MKDKLKLFGQKFFEAWSACSLVMVQGDLTALSLKHFLIAAKTGSLTGIAFVLISLVGVKNKYAPIWLTGILTSIADILVHPTHFGPHWAEALTTGIVAAVFAYLFTRFKKSDDQKNEFDLDPELQKKMKEIFGDFKDHKFADFSQPKTLDPKELEKKIKKLLKK